MLKQRATQKLAVAPSLPLPAETADERAFGTRKRRLVVLDRGLNAGKIGGQAGDSTLAERRRIAFGDEVEIAKASGSESGARGVVHVAGRGTSLRRHTRHRKCQQSQRGTAQRQAPAPRGNGPAVQEATLQEATYV